MKILQILLKIGFCRARFLTPENDFTYQNLLIFFSWGSINYFCQNSESENTSFLIWTPPAKVGSKPWLWLWLTFGPKKSLNFFLRVLPWGHWHTPLPWIGWNGWIFMTAAANLNYWLLLSTIYCEGCKRRLLPFNFSLNKIEIMH